MGVLQPLMSMDADHVLVLNAGSSSIKASVIAIDATGTSEHIWHGEQTWTALHQSDAPEAWSAELESILRSWLSQGLAPWLPTLTLVGHRVVHGGEQLIQATRIDEPVRHAIAAAASLAPLHNALALAVIDWMQTWISQQQLALSQWACFDTAFHHTLAPVQYSYAIPAVWRAQGLRRYGFHGLNHQHVAETVATIWHDEGHGDATISELRLISAHLGSGCSLCAIQGGRSVATSMGFTPSEGLVMATRSGSIDPGLLLHLLRQGDGDVDALEQALNHSSGLLGLSELSGDMRELRQAAAQGHPGAQLAIAVFTARLLEGIGAMAAVLRGVDVIVLTGGIGQNDEVLAHTLVEALAWLGPFRLLQVPANEEVQIARQCLAARP